MQRKKLKRNVSIALLGAMLVTSTPMPLMAEVLSEENYSVQNIAIQPRLQYIAQTMNTFGIVDGVAIVDCWVTGDILTATKTKVIAELQVKNGSSWIPVKIWTDTQNSYKASIDEEYAVTSGNTYRVKATFYVWEDTQSESLITISDEETA